MKKILNAIILPAAIGFFIIGLLEFTRFGSMYAETEGSDEGMRIGIGASYFSFMMSLGLLFLYKIRKNKEKEELMKSQQKDKGPSHSQRVHYYVNKQNEKKKNNKKK